MKRVLNLGSLNIDFVYQVPHVVVGGETLSSTDYSQHPGGKGANQSVALSLAGLAVSHAGQVSQDGLWLCDVLKEKGVDTSLIKIDDTVATGHAIIQVSDAGENSIILFGGANQSLKRSFIDEVLATHDWQALVLQNEINELDYILEQAIALNIPIIFNAAPYSKNLFDLSSLKNLHSLIVNETEAMELAQTDEIDSAFEILVKKYDKVRVIMTMGKHGVKASYLGESCFVAAKKSQVVDTTAAGDTFVGYYTKSILAEDKLHQALTMATAAASITVSRQGAMNAIPRLDELN